MTEQNYDLIVQLTRVEWLLHRYHLQNHMHFGPMGDPRKGQGRVLAILKMQPEISQKELSFLLDMRPQSLGELLSKLEKNGYITRKPSENDRRVQNIKLTNEGSQATESDSQEFSFDKLFECLSEEEQGNLGNYLSRIIETLEAQLGDEQSEHRFDPRLRGGNHFSDRFSRDSNSGREHPGPGEYDPRLEAERNRGNVPFRQGMRGMDFGSRTGTRRGHGPNPTQSGDNPDKE
ncbi:MAG: MarR family transcriptional regulator [Syntrophomonas sp.]